MNLSEQMDDLTRDFDRDFRREIRHAMAVVVQRGRDHGFDAWEYTDYILACLRRLTNRG